MSDVEVTVEDRRAAKGLWDEMEIPCNRAGEEEVLARAIAKVRRRAELRGEIRGLEQAAGMFEAASFGRYVHERMSEEFSTASRDRIAALTAELEAL
jgi:hypothetical protein